MSAAEPIQEFFSIGEVCEITDLKPHVLRYWEQEFTQLKPVKRRGNRRYYQHHEVLLIRRIRELLYEQGFTINGARHRLETEATGDGGITAPTRTSRPAQGPAATLSPAEIRQVIEEIRQILRPDR